MAVVGWVISEGWDKELVGSINQSWLLKWRDLFVTFGISYWNFLEFMTFDKLGICRYLNNDDFLFFWNSGINWWRFGAYIIWLLNENDESLPIRTKTVWCSLSIPFVYCIYFYVDLILFDKDKAVKFASNLLYYGGMGIKCLEDLHSWTIFWHVWNIESSLAMIGN